MQNEKCLEGVYKMMQNLLYRFLQGLFISKVNVLLIKTRKDQNLFPYGTMQYLLLRNMRQIYFFKERVTGQLVILQ